MNVECVAQRRQAIKDRVAHAYYNYGRLCSAHPTACLSISIVTIVLLSYPAAVRFKLPASSPMDVHWNEKHYVDKGERAPEWLYLKPSVYLQQIIVRGRVEPWNIYNLSAVLAVKGPLSRAFHLQQLLLQSPASSKHNFQKHCFLLHSRSSPSEGAELLPDRGCFMLSPTLFWQNDEQKFYRDDDIVDTIFSPPCTPSMCVRDMLLGMPTRLTGLKRRFQTNRHRSIDYALTLFFPKYDQEYITALRNTLSKQGYELQKSKAADDSTFIHVFYRPRKYIVDYFPLMASYCLLMLYIYFSVSKIVMVKSKVGLSLAAVFTVATALTMTAGICSYIEMIPSLWGAELFPYLALVVGLENTLCLTRSVVYTPPTMDVRSRVSQGLSQEGYSFTKYFLLEMCFLAVGYITFVPEIQEFCTFAFIGLVVDFYMQLFFYVPCLTFDLLRLNRADKEQFSVMLFNSDIRQYKTYPTLTCPMVWLWPRLFVNKMKLHRVKSESELKEPAKSTEKTPPTRTHRRTISAVPMKELHTSARLRLLYFWTRTRFVQRAMMVLFVVWTIWIGFIVHKWRLADAFNSNLPADPENHDSDSKKAADLTQSEERFGVSHRLLESAPLQWGEWPRSTFKWWPVVFAEYNLSLSGHYITFLPPIVLKATIPPNDPSIVFAGGASDEERPGDAFLKLRQSAKSSNPESKESILISRVYSLETQMTAILVVSAVFLFSTVTLFILYTCFPSKLHGTKSTTGNSSEQSLSGSDTKKKLKRVGSKSFIESVPLVFSGHTLAIECIGLCNENIVSSSCLQGRVFVWDAKTGEKKLDINRNARCWSNSQVNDQTSTRTVPEQERYGSLRHRTVPVAVVSSTQASTNGIASSSRDNKSNERRVVPQIWCMAVINKCILLGCADGCVEVANADLGEVIGVFEGSHSKAGVIHLKISCGRTIIVRLDGTVEFLDVRFSVDQPNSVHHMQSAWYGRAHQMPITRLEVGPTTAVTASHDHSLKVFDVRSSRLLFTLQGHNAPLVCAYVDKITNILYSSCEEGTICCWDLENGQLIRSIDDVFLTNETVEVACTAKLLLGHSSDGHLWIWDKLSGQLRTKIIPEASSIPKNGVFVDERRCLVAMNNELAATSCGDSLLFWDLKYGMLIRQVHISGCIDKLLRLDLHSVLCCSGNNLYRIDVPSIRLK